MAQHKELDASEINNKKIENKILKCINKTTMTSTKNYIESPWKLQTRHWFWRVNSLPFCNMQSRKHTIMKQINLIESVKIEFPCFLFISCLEAIVASACLCNRLRIKPETDKIFRWISHVCTYSSKGVISFWHVAGSSCQHERILYFYYIYIFSHHCISNTSSK